VLYFAYTSLIEPKALDEVCPGAEFSFIAHLPEFGLGFPYKNGKWEGGLPSAKPQPGSTVWGAVFELSKSQVKAVDELEASEGRKPTNLEVMDRGGRRHEVRAHPAQKTGPAAADGGEIHHQGLAGLGVGLLTARAPDSGQDLVDVVFDEHLLDHGRAGCPEVGLEHGGHLLHLGIIEVELGVVQRVDRHDAPHPIPGQRCCPESNWTAHGVAHQHDLPQIQMLQQVGHVLAESLDAPVLTILTALPVAGEIEGDDAIGPLQHGNLRIPESPIAHPAMHQHHCDVAAAADDVGHFRPIGGNEHVPAGGKAGGYTRPSIFRIEFRRAAP